MTKSAWISPSEALVQQEAGRILLMPPTLKIIEELNAFQNTDDLFSEAGSFCMAPILPEIFATDEGYGIKLPFDPEYSIAERRLPPRPGEPSRIFMRNGIWKVTFPEDHH